MTKERKRALTKPAPTRSGPAKTKHSPAPHDAGRSPTPPATGPRPAPSGGAARQHDDARALADAVFAEHDPVQALGGLLRCEDPRIAARAIELLLEYRFGKPVAAESARDPLRMVWDIPRPAREEE